MEWSSSILPGSSKQGDSYLEYVQGQPVGIRWRLKEAPDGGMSQPEDYSHAVYERYNGEDGEGVNHCVTVYYLDDSNEEYWFFGEEVFPLNEELKVEDFV